MFQGHDQAFINLGYWEKDYGEITTKLCEHGSPDKIGVTHRSHRSI